MLDDLNREQLIATIRHEDVLGLHSQAIEFPIFSESTAKVQITGRYEHDRMSFLLTSEGCFYGSGRPIDYEPHKEICRGLHKVIGWQFKGLGHRISLSFPCTPFRFDSSVVSFKRPSLSLVKT